jgi:hypothetical protein
MNARRLQPAYNGAWSVGAATPLPSAPDWLDPSQSKSSFYSTDVRFPDSEAFEWSNLADMFDASGTLRPSRAPQKAENGLQTRKNFATFDPSIYSDKFPGVGPSAIPSPLRWLESTASSGAKAISGLGISSANSVDWSSLTDLFMK